MKVSNGGFLKLIKNEYFQDLFNISAFKNEVENSWMSLAWFCDQILLVYQLKLIIPFKSF